MANPFEGIPAYPPQRDQESPLAAFFQRLQAAKQAKDLEEQRARAMMAQKGMELGQQRELKEAELSQEAKLRGRGLDIEQQRANQMGKGGHGAIPAEQANALLGENLFEPGTMVSPGERILAGQKMTREKPPVAARGQYLAIKDAEGFLNQMQQKFRGLSKQGKTGPVSGRFARAKAFISSGELEPEAAAYNRLKIGLVGRLKSVAGEVGRITDDDIKRMGALIAGLESGNVAAEDAFREIQATLGRGRANIEDVYPGVLKQMRGGSQSGEPRETEQPKRKGGEPQDDARAELAEAVRSGKMTAQEAAIKIKALRQK